MEESMLESQLSELQEKLGRMEAEMTIVSEESKDLQDTLESREAALVEKVNKRLVVLNKPSIVNPHNY